MSSSHKGNVSVGTTGVLDHWEKEISGGEWGGMQTESELVSSQNRTYGHIVRGKRTEGDVTEETKKRKGK